MRVSGVSFTISKDEDPRYLVSEDPNDPTVEITAGTKSVIITVAYSDRAEDENARLQRFFDSCDFLEVLSDGTVRFHVSGSLEGYSDKDLAHNQGFFAETLPGGDFFDYILLDPEQS